MAGESPALSLEDAVREKYCVSPKEDRETLPAHKTFRESGLRHKPDATPVQRRGSVVLDHRGVTHVGSGADLAWLCPMVEELVLAANSISQWKDALIQLFVACNLEKQNASDEKLDESLGLRLPVCAVLSSLPRLSLLDLSNNPLSSVDPAPSDTGDSDPIPSGSVDSSPSGDGGPTPSDTGDSNPAPSGSVDPSPSSGGPTPSDTGDSDPAPSGSVDSSPSPSLSVSLNTLVLNRTGIEWSILQLALDMLPCLQELHLSKNNYPQVDFDPTFQHKSLKRLHINDNSLADWREIEKLSPAFPGLQILVATSNPLAEVPPLDPSVFPELNSLNLNGAKISKWKCIDQLNALSRLNELSLLKLPLAAEMEEKNRRFAIVARLPKLKKLNKSDISESEREDAERWLIRQCMRDPNPPTVYDSLVKKHGNLSPLAEVDMTPKLEANIEFCYEDFRRSEIHRVKLNQSVSSLTKWVGRRIHLAGSKFRLIYVHTDETLDEELMWSPSKRLYSFDVEDGDRIRVQII